MIIQSLQNNSENSKKRNIIVTILLSIFLISDLYVLKTITDSNPNNDTIDLTEKINYSYVFFTVLDLVFTFFIFKWKKWAFWGTLIISIFTFLLNIYVGVKIIFCFAGLIGILLLFASLQLKSGNVSGWKNLE
ncbi:hypothetical protein [Flavobacterium psychrophilum]|uniref:hypothetical protein n=1 Tax=Flavobacterium psychrophilum TaxID=96345 RepID=UPI001D09022D|nr:hypothetical protein [Flavobacterium psychrophilum]EKT3958663.1 hypothetical protein [Flavobacterium psychrophilum]ELV7526138.1 hypothetical protein [Flavobacterium psychrophilum]MCB6089502.1 hypothetical protein [Flavobacterium psychrophilum]